MDLDAICGDKWIGIGMGVLDGGGDRRRRRGSFGDKCGVWGSNVALPKLFWGFLFK